MAVLNKAWGSLERVSPREAEVVTGAEASAETEKAAEKPVASQPFFIYVTDETGAGSSDTEKIDKVILYNNDVCIGMWAFTCVKMTPAQVAADPLIADAGKATPRLLFVSHDYADVEVLEDSKLSASKVYDAMKKFAKKAYKTNFDKNVQAMGKILIEWDKINNQRKVLEEKEKREGADMSPADRKKIAKEREEIEKAQKEADEKKESLLRFELREKAS
jgi:hypothetical protein